MATYINRGNGFYPIGVELFLDDNGKYYAPRETDYPKHCHFLTKEMVEKNTIAYEKKEGYIPSTYIAVSCLGIELAV